MPDSRSRRRRSSAARRPLTGPCTFCQRPATRRATIRHPDTGEPEKVQVCMRHYLLHYRTGRFWNVERWLTPAKVAEARRRRARGEAIIDLAREYSINYRTMQRYLSPTKPERSMGHRMK